MSSKLTMEKVFYESENDKGFKIVSKLIAGDDSNLNGQSAIGNSTKSVPNIT